MRQIGSIALALALPLGALAPAAAAQCLVPDNLDSAPCCQPVPLDLPQFPPIAMVAQGDCWTACTPPLTNCLRVSVAPPSPTANCGSFVAPMDVSDCGATPMMIGELVLDYTRTWSERPAGALIEYQVWRFAAKVDLFPVTLGVPPMCPMPDCLGPNTPAFFYGYVDYALNCATGAFESSLVLFHNCDDFIHDPAFSSVPGAFHPGRTYAIVGPDTAANPFVPTSAPPPPAAPLVAEAMRSMVSLIPGVCLAEEPIVGGLWAPLITGCLCPLNFVPAQNAGVLLDGVGACGGSFKSVNLWPTLPWFDLTTTSLGTWTTGASYPGPERVSVAEGLLRYTDPCGPAGAPVNSADVFYGGLTEKGYDVIPTPGVTLTPTFLDLASNFRAVLPGPVPLPLFGSVGPTDHLIYVNF